MCPSLYIINKYMILISGIARYFKIKFPMREKDTL